MNPLTPYMMWIKVGAIVALLLGVWTWGDRHGAAGVQGKFDKHLLADKTAEANAERAARAMEHAQAVEVAHLMDENAKQRAADEASEKRLIDDLLSARRQLRARWTCGVPATPGSAEGVDGATPDQAESIGRIANALDAQERQTRALQDFIRAERK